MKHENPFRGSRRPLSSDHLQGSSGPGWANVRARIQAALDAIEDGDVRLAEAILLDLLADLEPMGRAA